MSITTDKNIRLYKSDRTEYGVIKQGEDYIFTASFCVKKELKLYIADMNGNTVFYEAISDYKIAGNVYSVRVCGLNLSEFTYYYVCDEKAYLDPYMKVHNNKRLFGEKIASNSVKKAVFTDNHYDFEDDRQLSLNQSDVIAYQLHVRGFTKDASSKVKGKGCFLGITEKIPYLVELGINQIELMPAYDFYEYDVPKERIVNHSSLLDDALYDSVGKSVKTEQEEKLNYWGYKEANYFCPKYEYSYSDNAEVEFKDMVKSLHKSGIEVIMQMFFTRQTKATTIIDCLRFWYTEYHVDGFHVMGESLPVELIIEDDILAEAKIYINNIDTGNETIAKAISDRNIYNVNDGYLYSMRRFLKSDGDSLAGFVYHNRLNGGKNRALNYITKYEGFTLNDLVSYEHKHNEDNGENNIDGNSYNFSWNCGVEGKSTKKAVKELRIRQIKNALCILLLSQGTPMMFMGDEFMNTQNGNNNPYCQDNEITWLSWKKNKSSEEVFEFTKMLISLRKQHRVLHQDKELKNMDYLSTGFPDISYHQDMAWKSELNNYLLHIGIMLDGAYVKVGDKEEDTLYIAYNMHWENHLFGIPRLKQNMKWVPICATCTADEFKEIEKDLLKTPEEMCVYKRSVVVLKAVKDVGAPKKANTKVHSI